MLTNGQTEAIELISTTGDACDCCFLPSFFLKGITRQQIPNNSHSAF